MDADDAASLAERLKSLKVREAKETESSAVERAIAEKSGLAERMREMLAQKGQELPPPPPKPVIVIPPAPTQGEVAPEVQVFTERLRQLKEQSALPKEPEAAKPAVSDRRRLIGWFLGRAAQDEGSGPVTQVPAYDADAWTEIAFYDIEPPYAYVRVLQSKGTGEYLYEAIEPQLSESEEKVLAFVEDALVRGLNVDPGQLKAEAREAYLVEAVRQIMHDYRIRVSKLGQARVEYYLRRDFLGLGPIHPVMVDPNIEDISCDGPDEGLFIFHRQFESIATNIKFRNDAQLDGFVIRLAQRSGKAISVSDPILDAALPDGSRLQATLGREVTQNGSTFTIRRFKPDPFTPIDLIRFGTMSVDLLAWFWLIVQHGSSLIFSGGTASGKTTALNAISQFIPQTAKVVSIEDTREVNLPHKNWIKSVTRSGSSAEGTGEIGMFELLKASLRQRPEYILVGEVRGIEATVAFQAMATGHTVYSTMHADSARSVVYRLENEPINIPRLVLQALDVIAIQGQARFQGKRVRRVKEVVELVGMDPSTKELLTNTVFRWDPADDHFEYGGRSYLLERIGTNKNWSREQVQAEFNRRKRILAWMRENNVRDVRTLTDAVKAYYRDPVAFCQSIGVPP